jgi:hypothetical protein
VSPHWLLCRGDSAPERGPSCRAPLGLVKWITLSSLKMFTSSMAGIVFTLSRFSVFCSRLSSVVLVLCTAFFFLRNQIGRATGQQTTRQTACSVERRRIEQLERRPAADEDNKHCSLCRHAPADGALAACAHDARHLLQLFDIHGCESACTSKQWRVSVKRRLQP